ncbi:MAG: SDR family oxidoreductase [Verrucomicrobiae bacterium]|nr:SDR family oxidoreductase [Verrucomicrobiae bacterium]
MKLLPGQTVLLTGASGGLGTHITHALAERGVKLALVAHPGVDLEKLRQEVAARGVRAVAYQCDLRDAAQRRHLAQQVEADLGPVDVLINNAGVEHTAPYHELSEADIDDVLKVNLEAPMMLTRLVLPGMLARRRGHIVNMSSLAGKSGPAFQEPYAATKAGLIAFTSSLRATYRGSGVSASVIVPGFVEAGIYASLKAQSGCAAPALLGTSRPETVAQAVIRAIERDTPEVIINPMPVRPLLVLTIFCPRAGAWLANKLGANDFFRRVVQVKRERGG